MKSIIFTLFLLAGAAGIAIGQQLPANFLPKSIVYGPDQVVSLSPNTGTSGSNRGVNTFEVSYHDMDRIYSDDNGFDFGYFTWDLNFNARINTNPYNDSGADFIRWGAVIFDSIYDYNAGVAYNPSTFTSMTLDSIYILFRHENTSNTPDTLVITVYETANNASGYTFAPGSNGLVITNTVLYSDTIIDSVSFTPNATPTALYSLPIPLTTPVTIPQGKSFIVEARYYGPLEDLFSIADGNRLECGPPSATATNAASRSVVPGNTARYYNQLFAPDSSTVPVTPADSSLAGLTGLGYGPPFAANCNIYFFQNLAISAVVSVDAPLSANATSSETIVCPGEFVVLNSGASGGSGDYAYTWSGNGNFTSPNSSSTSVAIPSGNGVDTFTVTVIDNIENTTVTSSVNVTVRGIVVNLGNDTTLNCGDSILVGANTTGFLNGSQFVWSTGATTQATFLKGGSTYSVTVTNNAGCTTTDSKVVGLNVNQAVSFVPTTFYNGNSTDTVGLVQNRACQGTLVFFENTSTDLSSTWSWAWDYGDQTGSTNIDGLKAYSNPTVYTVTLTATDASGCVITSAPLQLQVLPAGSAQCVTGIAELELLSNISMFPNPNAGTFTVDMTNVSAEDANIMVVDLMGKVVSATNTFSTAANPVQTIEMNNAASGIYFVRITANGVTATSKISVAK